MSGTLEKPMLESALNAIVLTGIEERRRAQKEYRDTHKEALKATRIKSRSKRQEYDRIRYLSHKEQKSAYNKEYRIKNREKLDSKNKKYQIEHKKELTAYYKIYDSANKERKNQWRKDNPEKIKEHNKRSYIRITSTAKGKLNNAIRRGIATSLHGSKNGRPWEQLVGYTLDKLQKHLEKLFDKNMTWNNYGSYWHIDHIIPVSAFNFELPENIDFKKCWALKNLRPLEAKENIRKSNKLNTPFQPSLKI